MSIYKTANYFLHWKFPTSVERLAAVILPHEVGKVALEVSSSSLYLKTTGGWLLINSAASTAEAYTPLQSFDGEVIPASKQRLVSGDYEVIGNLELIGDLVIL